MQAIEIMSLFVGFAAIIIPFLSVQGRVYRGREVQVESD